MKQKNIFFGIIALWLMPIGLYASSVQQLWSEISNAHAALKKIDDKYNQGDISLKKSEEKKYPLWKQLAESYNSLSSNYFYNSKSSVNLVIPSAFTSFSISIPNMADFALPASDIAVILAALNKGSVLDVRLFFNAKSKILFYAFIDIATNLSVTSGVIPTSLKVAPATWYILVEINGKWNGTNPQTLTNSISIQIS